jgi:hypothetical protein
VTYLFLAVLACTLALGGWLIARAEPDLPFHRLSARAARNPGAAENGARAESPLGARPTLGHPAPAATPAQLKNPGVGHQK